MMNFADHLIIQSVVISFGAYVLAHLLLSRFVPATKVLSFLMYAFWGGFIAQVAVFFYLLMSAQPDTAIGKPASAIYLATSLGLYAMVCFCYVICIFGPFESSIRIRIIRELFKFYPQKLSKQQFKSFYNDDIIVKTRLGRLIEARDLSFDGKLYRTNKKINFFSIFENISILLKKIYGISVK